MSLKIKKVSLSNPFNSNGNMPTTRIITQRLPSKPSLMFKERKRCKEIIKVVIALTYRVGSEQSRTMFPNTLQYMNQI